MMAASLLPDDMIEEVPERSYGYSMRPNLSSEVTSATAVSESSETHREVWRSEVWTVQKTHRLDMWKQ